MQPPPSALTLGSAQFGSEYGVANQSGRPSFATVCDIIRTAYEGGVDTIDTAAGYGESEEWIGRALKELGLRDRMRVVTKVAALGSDLTKQEAAKQIEASVVRSLKLLGLDKVPLCLFHREYNIQYTDELLALRDRGLIDEAGVSLGSPEYAAKALKLPGLTAWQIASNLLDRRYTHSGLTIAAKKAGVTIFVRSVLLQGLILMDDASTPPHLHPVIAPRQKLRDVAKRFNLSLSELAVRGITGRPEIASVVVGVETVAQIKDNNAILAKGPLPAEVLQALEELQPDLPENILNPAEWTKLKAAYEARLGQTKA